MAKLVTYTLGDKFDFFRTTGSLTTTNITETVLMSVLIPASSMTADNITIFRIEAGVAKTGTANSASCRFYVNTSGVIAGATQLASFTIPSTTLTTMFSRFGAISSSTSTEFFGSSTSNSSDYFGQAGGVTTVNINWTVDQYIILAGNVVNAADSIGGFYLKVSN